VPQAEVSLDGVQALILQLIGAQLLSQAYPSALLMLIEQHSSAFFRDHPQGQVELVMTIASQRVEDISGGAL
jgi:hypothetical protein